MRTASVPTLPKVRVSERWLRWERRFVKRWKSFTSSELHIVATPLVQFYGTSFLTPPFPQTDLGLHFVRSHLFKLLNNYMDVTRRMGYCLQCILHEKQGISEKVSC